MTRRPMWPSRLVTLSASGKCGFRGSMASLHDPRPTLRLAPHGTRRTAWGRCDSLGLHRGGLSPPTPCRSPDALPARIKKDSPAAAPVSWPAHGSGFARPRTGSGRPTTSSLLGSAKSWVAGPSPAMTRYTGRWVILSAGWYKTRPALARAARKAASPWSGIAVPAPRRAEP